MLLIARLYYNTDWIQRPTPQFPHLSFILRFFACNPANRPPLWDLCPFLCIQIPPFNYWVWNSTKNGHDSIISAVFDSFLRHSTIFLRFGLAGKVDYYERYIMGKNVCSTRSPPSPASISPTGLSHHIFGCYSLTGDALMVLWDNLSLGINLRAPGSNICYTACTEGRVHLFFLALTFFSWLEIEFFYPSWFNSVYATACTPLCESLI